MVGWGKEVKWVNGVGWGKGVDQNKSKKASIEINCYTEYIF